MLERRKSLSVKLLQLVLMWALVVGLILSCAQILYDIANERQQLDRTAAQILAMSRDPATQAVYSLDREMATQVVEGLFEHPAVRHAAIGHPDEPALAQLTQSLAEGIYRRLTDRLLGAEQQYSIELYGRSPHVEYYGNLDLILDTAPYVWTCSIDP